ncbi:LysM peptidoglycan-binding domain-containing C40 family peptidase, partial [Streptomyces sp.]|uniref:C40 family peptidase n=1 Tax=Streptomyces sp. TaxID=1931 RepID=UPI002F91EF61
QAGTPRRTSAPAAPSVRARGRHGAPTEWSVAAVVARLLPPEAASIATAALRVAGVTVLGVLAVLFGVVLAQAALPDAPPAAARPSTVLQPPAQKPADEAPADPPPAAEPAPSKPTTVRTVLLRPGDTLWSLAQRHHTTVAALQKANGLGSSTTIYAGERLRLAALPDRAVPDRVTPTPPPGKAVKGKAHRAVQFARAQLGKPYVWGGTGPYGYDCSGLVQRAWRAAGVKVSRTTYTQVHDGSRTARARLAPGDLVITNHGHHVLLYVGDGKVIEAPRPGARVRTAPLPPHGQVVAYRHIAR